MVSIQTLNLKNQIQQTQKHVFQLKNSNHGIRVLSNLPPALSLPTQLGHQPRWNHPGFWPKAPGRRLRSCEGAVQGGFLWRFLLLEKLVWGKKGKTKKIKYKSDVLFFSLQANFCCFFSFGRNDFIGVGFGFHFCQQFQ